METTLAGRAEDAMHSASRNGAASSGDPLVGQVLDHRYQLIAPIASGGMASVYEARDQRLGRNVAVKVMRAAEGEDPRFVERLISEARAAAALSHPSIVSVYDQGADGDVAYLVMEKVDGHTLREVLNERTLSVSETLAVCEQVAEALAVAHEHGFVHRDIKPENVLLAEGWGAETGAVTAGLVKVADFGLARAVEASTRHTANGVVMGTVAYVAPEQISNPEAEASPRSDVYSVGIMLFEMLTGKPPFTNPSAANVAFQHVHNDVPRPSAHKANITSAVDELVVRATKRNPQERFSDARDMLAAVRTIRAGMGLRAVDPKRTTRLPSAASSSEATQLLDRVPASATTILPVASPAGVYGGSRPPRDPGSRRAHRVDNNDPKKKLVIAAIVTVVAVLAATIGWWLWSSGQTTITPSLVGVSQQQAERLVDNVGLEIHYKEAQFSETVKEDHVIKQSPAANESIGSGETITVTLSKGPERHKVPDVSGLSEEDATGELGKSKLKTKVIRENHKDVSEGDVIRTEPAAGQALPTGGYVTLVVSKGVKAIEVPDVVGMQLSDAEAKLTGLGLKVKLSGERTGTVSSQTPAAGSPAKEGDTVTLLVADGIVVPDVTGKKYREAKAELEARGFKVDKGPGSGSGTVFAQNPPGGTTAREGQKVTLWAEVLD